MIDAFCHKAMALLGEEGNTTHHHRGEKEQYLVPRFFRTSWQDRAGG